ncbi:aryl-alcohol dehydrogenase [Grosmannia clavigera kw1407]|uniref:Aryl-alcohol dehydrogenase n=1 Tax=Grosmannia clavigera (strain kw1407 / UAMH 11150) TaxID=655863 RepID=F0XAX9_GROCL|nr:aryl-alcohol dehydrogenase [Grosmannia clavigera kw1407]EFX05157.1 aryl-alcohol dehydrogenase [Grosmannia clavigera kw1407]
MSLFNQAPPPPTTPLGRLRILSTTAGIRVSPLQLGAMSIGEAWKDFLGVMDKKASFALLDAFVEAGGNMIDTANVYQDGQSEMWIGEWMAARQNRHRIVLATKFSNDFQYVTAGKGNAANSGGNSRRSIRTSLAASLEKLQTDFVDVLYLHFWDYTTSIPEVMDTLHALVQEGKVLYLGVSDTPAWIVAAANTYAQDHGRTPFSIYQGRWNVLVRDMEREILPLCRHFGMAIAPWDALGSGKFQSRAAIAARHAQGETLRISMVPGGSAGAQSVEEESISAALEQVASEHGIASVTAVALAYVMTKAPRVFPIIGGRKIEHLHDNIQSLSISLTDKQLAFLESVKPFDFGFPHNFIGQDPNGTNEQPRPLARAAHVDFRQPLLRR